MMRDEHDDVRILYFCALLFLSMKNMMNAYEVVGVCVSRFRLIHSSACLHVFMCLWTCIGPAVACVAN
jgi:hypothetical protein